MVAQQNTYRNWLKVVAKSVVKHCCQIQATLLTANAWRMVHGWHGDMRDFPKSSYEECWSKDGQLYKLSNFLRNTENKKDLIKLVCPHFQTDWGRKLLEIPLIISSVGNAWRVSKKKLS